MRLILRSTGSVVNFDSRLLLGQGGEGAVYQSPTDSRLVAKVYHQGKAPALEKLELMLAHPPADPMAGMSHPSIAWPVDILVSELDRKQARGFLMKKVSGFHEIHQLYDAQDRLRYAPLFTYKHLVRTATNLASSLRAIHQGGYVVGDINEQNVGVTDTALVTISTPTPSKLRMQNAESPTDAMLGVLASIHLNLFGQVLSAEQIEVFNTIISAWRFYFSV